MSERSTSTRLYVESPDWPDYSYGEDYCWLTCGDCGWDGLARSDHASAMRDGWRHPRLLCWLVRRIRTWRYAV